MSKAKKKKIKQHKHERRKLLKMVTDTTILLMGNNERVRRVLRKTKRALKYNA